VPALEEQDAFVKKYLVPYLNVVKFCPTDKSVVGCLPDVEYGFVHGQSGVNYSAYERPQMLLADGSTMEIYFANTCLSRKISCVDVHIDVNGHKKPNVIGRDVYGFSFYPVTNEFLPGGTVKEFDETLGKYKKTTSEELHAKCSEKGSSSWGCAARVVADGFKINY